MLRGTPVMIGLVVALIGAGRADAEPIPGASGDSTLVLPQGIFKTDVRYVYAWTGYRQLRGTPQFDGDEQSALFADLAGMGGAFGESSVTYSATAKVFAPSIFYGVTDRIAVGVALPVFLDASVKLHGFDVETGALGYNPDFTSDMERQSPVLSVSDPRAVSGAEGAKRVLSEVFRYEPLEDWSGSGVGDLQAISRAALYERGRARIAAQANVKIPTGTTDDPDNLIDLGLGSGQVDASALALVDVHITDPLVWNLRTGYTAQLPNHQRARVYENESLPFAPRTPLPGAYAELGRTRDVVRDLGDVWQVGSSLTFQRDTLVVGAGYDLYAKGEDHYRSDAGDHPAMSAGTDLVVHVVSGQIGLDWSRAFLRGDFPVPVILNLSLSQAISRDVPSNVSIATATATLFLGSTD